MSDLSGISGWPDAVRIYGTLAPAGSIQPLPGGVVAVGRMGSAADAPVRIPAVVAKAVVVSPVVVALAPAKRGRGRPPKATSSPVKVAAPPAKKPPKAVRPYFLKVEDVTRITTLCKSDIYDAMDAGTFPKQILIGLRRVAWKYRDAIDWCIEQERAAREGREAVWPPPWRSSIQ